MTTNQIFRRPAVLLGVCALLAIAYAWLAQRTYDYSSGDEAVYIGLARSLAAGEGYRVNGNFDAPYPPGMSALLIPASALSGDSYLALSRFSAVFGVLGIMVVATYGVIRRQRGWAVMCAMLLTSAGYFRVATSGVEADVPYLVFSVGLLAFVEWLYRKPVAASVWLTAPVAGILLVASIATRSIGVAILAGLLATGLQLLLSRRRRGADGDMRSGDLISVGIAGGIGAAWWVAWGRWSASHRALVSRSEILGTYTDQLRMLDPHQPDLGFASPLQLLLRMPRGVVTQVGRAAELLTNVSGLTPVWFAVPILVTATLIGIGLVRELRRPNPLLAWYSLAYIGVLALWPFDEGIRFMLPIFPLLLICIANSLEWMVVPTAKRRLQVRRLATALALIGALGAATTAMYTRQLSLQGLAWLAVWVVVLVLGLSGVDSRLPIAPLSPRWRTSGLFAFVLLYAILGTPSIVRMAAARLDPTRPVRREGLRRGADWIRRNTDTNAVVMSTWPRAMHYTTGRLTVALPITARAEALTGAITRWKPDYLILEDPIPFEYLRPTPSEQLAILEGAAPQSLQLVARVDGARIFRVSPDAISPRAIGGAADRTP